MKLDIEKTEKQLNEEKIDDVFEDIKKHVEKIANKKMSFIELINNAKYYGGRGYRFGAVKDVAKMVAYSIAVIIKAKEQEEEE